ncbi:class I SAM-dependent methyltransferase [Streptomyces sp. NPDC059618]|uniref:class I SAM-dependent methyltransferase n=1 Tax=Streptomyces sp. NPDC059618 TaxID=3346887 RepID=UPI0036A4791D
MGDHRAQPGRCPRPAAPGTPEGGVSTTTTPTSGPDSGIPAEKAVSGPDSGTAEEKARTGVPGQRVGDPDTEEVRYAPQWLQLREPADAAARAVDLLDPLRIRLANRPGRGDLAIHDLGCGTGSMGRWLAPRLDGAQHWILHDRDPYLLHFATVGAPKAAADGSHVGVTTQRGDIGRLTADALAGASLVTASALLDVLTAEEIDRLAAACAGAGVPALLTLSVAGRVEIGPSDPLDAEITEAFNAHQRRGDLLGPDAVTAACEAFARYGATVRVNPSPWRLGPAESDLAAEWLRGWVGAAVEQRPELAERAKAYLESRLAACAAGELRVVVHHSDVLALPHPAGGAA